MRRSLAILFAAGAANEARGGVRETTPLDKVVALLGDLQTKLLQEGEQEATTYERFACFCRDTTAEKGQAIADGQGAKTVLEADLAAAVVARDGKDASIAGANAAMAQLRGEIEDLAAARRAGLIEYEKAEVDLTAALQSLDAAIQSLRAAHTATSASLLQSLGPLASSVQRAVAMADTLGYLDAKSAEGARVVAALQTGRAGGAKRALHGGSLRAGEDPEVFAVPDSVYDFSSGSIVDTLKDLKTKFRAKKDELDTQEAQDRSEYDSLVQTKEGSIADHQTALDTAAREKAATVEKIAGLSTDLSTTSAQLLDDQRVLSEVSKNCGEKAVLWDQRSKGRADELSALASALAVLKDLRDSSGEAPSQAPPAAAAALIAARAPEVVRRAPRIGAPGRRVSLAARAAAPAGDAAQRARVVSLLTDGATRVRSAMLRAVAMEAKEDPFAKVKAMIQELIERLLKEAESEANHKGWCDKEAGLAEQQRTYAAEEIRELNGQLATLEARGDQLELFLDGVGRELQEINETLANSSSLREQEKAKNAQAIKDAKDGKAAVEKAYAILQQYYREAASKAALLQVGAAPAPAAPDAGFDGAYTGAQGAQTGITGMLELIMADFDEAVEDTEKDEKASAKDFLELETTLGASRAEKMVVQEQRQKALADTKTEYTAAWGKLEEEQKKLDGALTEFLALKPACFDSGMSAAERQAQREEEMASLKKALCVLDQHELNGIEC